MPTITCAVRRVSFIWCTTKRGQQQKFLVETDFDALTHRGHHGGVFETWNALQASACDRAQQTGRLVTLTYRDSPKWGSELVAVEFAEPVSA